MFRNNNAMGVDGIPAELLKTKRVGMAILFRELKNSIWPEEIMPEDWRKNVICPINKKVTNSTAEAEKDIVIGYMLQSAAKNNRKKVRTLRKPGRITTWKFSD